MEALLGQVAQRLTDRWLADRLLPGLLWCATAVAAYVLGWGGRQPVGTVVDRAEAALRRLDGHPVRTVLVLLILFGAAMLAGTVADAIGAGVRTCWLGQWPGRLGDSWVNRRQARVRARLTADGTTLPDAYLPHRATWMGERMYLVDVRVKAQYGLRLGLVWPRLWLLLDPEQRLIVRAAGDRFVGATRLAGWGVLSAVLVALWWPAGLAGLVLFLAAWHRGRAAAVLLSDTIESTVDLQHRALAVALGHPVPADRPLSRTVADAINDQLHKGATPQPQLPAYLHSQPQPQAQPQPQPQPQAQPQPQRQPPPAA